MGNDILSIDLGTTSLKTALYDTRGKLKGSTVVEYTLLTEKANFVEAEPKTYLNAIKECLARLREKQIDLSEVAVLGFSVQGETFLVLDEAGRPLRNAIVWMDNRAANQAEELRAHFGDELCYQVTGQVSFEACWPAAKLLWLRQNEPEVFSKIRHVVLLEDYIIYLLTGKFVAEGSLLCSTEYWDIRSKQYWQEMLEYLDVDPAWLPEIREPGELVGTLRKEIAEELGLPETAAVSTGCLDQAAGAVGVGNIRPGILSENIGAALAICVPTAKLTYDPNRQMPVHYFALPDTYMMHTFTTGGMCLRWFRDTFCAEEISVQNASGMDSYDIKSKEAAAVPPGADGLITLPHLQGSMAPDVNLDAKGVFYGLTLMHKKGHFIRSIMESLGYIICRNLEAIEAMGLDVDEIRTMGGGSKSPLWNQIKSDITGKSLLTTYSAQDTACLGAAILAGKAAGLFESVGKAADEMVAIKKVYAPQESNCEIYRKQYRKYCLLFRSLDELYRVDAAQ